MGALLAMPAGAAYARLVEPRWLEARRQSVLLPGCRLSRPVRLLHLSDLHASGDVPLSFIGEAIDMGLAWKPDLIAVTGDFVSAFYDDWKAYSDVLCRLSDAAPTFACLGNHDGGAWAAERGYYNTPAAVAQCLLAAGIRLLDNATILQPLGGDEIAVTGLGDFWSGYFRPSRAFAAAGQLNAAVRIVLSHNPDSKAELLEHPWDLMLSGHTHGGQIVVPLVGPPFAPVTDHRFIEGLHPWEGRQLFITRGVGSLHRLRFNCRPEVSLLTLLPA